MNTLERQLSEYGEYRSERQTRIDVQELIAVALEGPGPDVPKRNGLVVAIGVGAVVLMAGLLSVLLLTPGTGESPGTGEPLGPTRTTIDFSRLTPAEFEFDPSERPRLENQAEFVRLFSWPGSGGCIGSGLLNRGPYLCSVEFRPPLVPEAVIIETVVGDDQTTPGEPGSPDDRPMLTVAMTESRQLIEPILADLYTWALDTYPENTEAACGVGFTSDGEAIAWNPGYRADIPCGEHLLNHLGEFMDTRR